MIPQLRIPLIGLLIVVLSHALIPWVHTHEGMTKGQLLAHLTQYHRGGPISDVPVGWHCHLIQLAAPEVGTEPQALVDSQTASRLHDWLDALAHSCHFHAGGWPITSPAAIASTAALDEANATLSKVDLFKLYESLLI